MTRDPYTRQIWQHTASAAASAAISTLVAAGATALITDSDVTGAPAVTAVVTLWLTELIWSGSRIRADARRVTELREQQALHRQRRMRRRSREHLEPLPGVDGLSVARDARVIEDHAHAEAMAAVAADAPLPERAVPSQESVYDAWMKGVPTDGTPALPPLGPTPTLPATVPMPTVDAAAVLTGPTPYAVRTAFDPAGPRTVVAEPWAGRAA